MMSPIAIASARHSFGTIVKGSGRRRTVYKRPPIVELIGMVGSIQALGRLRGALATGALHGTIDPSEKTERKWERAFWKQVVELILKSKNPTFEYNVVKPWAKPNWAELAVQTAFELQCKSLP
jgi:(p)ppGpp synthase/HD superfamily hydrolase